MRRRRRRSGADDSQPGEGRPGAAPRRDLADLHIHVGGAVAPHVLWSIAHDQGFKLPVSDYWEFKELVSARPGKVRSLDEYLAVEPKKQLLLFGHAVGRPDRPLRPPREARRSCRCR